MNSCGQATVIEFQGHRFEIRGSETVLECLRREGADIPSSCKSGICGTCMMRAVNGNPPAKSQIGLKPTLRETGHFLPCICHADQDLEVAMPDSNTVNRAQATVVSKLALNHEILQLILECESEFNYRAGQFVSVRRKDGLIRSYSLAGLPDTEKSVLELHIRRIPGGAMSEWVHDNLSSGDSLDVSGPSGSCFYVSNDLEQPLLLVGTGSGLAPLVGIVRDALHHGHVGNIQLYHGSWNPQGLYMVDELRELEARHSNFQYFGCVDEGATDDLRTGRCDLLALADHTNLKGWRVFLCGHPGMIQSARRAAFMAGVSMADIYSDPFVYSKK